MLLANPFPFGKSTYPKVLELIEKERITKRANLAFLHHAKHPIADRDAAEFTPGWNGTNAEIMQLDHDGCYLLFGRDGNLLFAGRTTDQDIASRLERALK